MSSDDEDQGHSINDDYRMEGLRGDEESDLEVDAEELLGSRAAPIEVVDAAGDGAANAAAGDVVGVAGAAAGDGAAGAVAGDGAALVLVPPLVLVIQLL
jgi:hypothetical protein